MLWWMWGMALKTTIITLVISHMVGVVMAARATGRPIPAPFGHGKWVAAWVGAPLTPRVQ